VAKRDKRGVGVVILLDSNIIIYLSKELVSIDDIFFDANELYSISIITYMEILGFRFENQEEKNIIEQILENLHILYIDKQVADKVIELKQIYNIKLPDAIICATSIINKALLITNDIRLNNIKNLKTKNIKNFIS